MGSDDVVRDPRQLSPELSLVCPELGAEARARLPERPWEAFLPPVRPTASMDARPPQERAVTADRETGGRAQWGRRLAAVALPVAAVASMVGAVTAVSYPDAREAPVLVAGLPVSSARADVDSRVPEPRRSDVVPLGPTNGALASEDAGPPSTSTAVKPVPSQSVAPKPAVSNRTATKPADSLPAKAGTAKPAARRAVAPLGESGYASGVISFRTAPSGHALVGVTVSGACGRVAFARRLKVSRDGQFSGRTQSRPSAIVSGRFTSASSATGWFRIRGAGCDSGRIPFVAALS